MKILLITSVYSMKYITAIMLLICSSCSSKLIGDYCNKSKLISTTLQLNQNKEFILITNTKFHGSEFYYQTGNYIAVKDTLILIINKEGLERDSLVFLPKIDTVRAYFVNSKIVVNGEKSNLILRRCYDK